MYLQRAETVEKFNEVAHLDLFLHDNPNNTEEQKIIDFEKNILLLSGLTKRKITIEETDLFELKSHIHTRLTTDNRYLKLLYKIAYINLKIKLRDFEDRPCDMLCTWFEEFNELSKEYRPDDSASAIASLLNTYLTLSKKSCDKSSNKNSLKAYDFIINFEENPEPFAHFCNTDLLSFFSVSEREVILNHFFESLEDKVKKLTNDGRSNIFLNDNYLLICLRKIIDLSDNYNFNDLKHKVTNYLIINILSHIEYAAINPLTKYGRLQYCLEISKHHKDKEKIKNDILLKIIKYSKEIHIQTIGNINTFEQKISQSYQDTLNKHIELYRKYNTLDCLTQISRDFFNSSERILEYSQHKEIDFAMLASELLLDDSGLIRGIVNDDESRRFSDLKQNIIILYQLKLPLFLSITEKESFEEELLKIELFNSNDDKHIRNALINFLEKDYHGFVSRSIPLIEKKLRLLLRSLGEADILSNKIGGFDFRPMNAFMSSQVIADVFTEPVRFMFKVLYDDRRGFNLRNKVAHGIVEADEIDFFHALLVLYTIVYLATTTLKSAD